VRFLGWKKTHDQWVSSEFVVQRDEQDVAPAGRPMDIIVGGDAQQVVVDDTDPDALVDEEGGNQWLYSCVVCGDGGDVIMCDTVR
jgi:hypothetical protein